MQTNTVNDLIIVVHYNLKPKNHNKFKLMDATALPLSTRLGKQQLNNYTSSYYKM